MTARPTSVSFRYPSPPIEVRVKRRLHRFGAEVRTAQGLPVVAHVPNPGRMRELLVPGSTGWMVPTDAAHRRTAGTLVSLRHGPTIVSIDTLLANRLVGDVLAAGDGPGRFGVPEGAWRPEFSWGTSRFDFGLPGGGPDPVALVEVKSANLRVGTGARFPDAPTVRGARHLRELAEARRRGISAHVIFVVQRADVEWVGPHREMDPVFGRACDAASRAGVRFGAVRMVVRPDGASLGRELPVVDIPQGNRPTDPPGRLLRRGTRVPLSI